MKGILPYLMTLCILTYSQFAHGQRRFAYLPKGKVYFEVSDQALLVAFKETTDSSYKSQLKNKSFLHSKFKSIESINNNLSLINLKLGDKSTAVDTLKDIINKLNKEQNILYSGEFLTYQDGTLQGITDQINIKIKASTQLNDFIKLIEQYRLSAKKSNFNQYEYLLVLENQNQGDALEIANLLFETGLFEYAEPNFLRKITLATSDTYYSSQWAINNTGQNGGTSDADMDVPEAWAITTGCSTIKIAVIDNGVDLSHPDLVDNLLTGYDATSEGSNGAATDSDSHGTACAGIIAAKANNDKGIAGVAYNSKIIPIRAYTGDDSFTYDNSISGAIIYAYSNAQADIISCSWGGGSEASIVTNAINDAVSLGRNGKGSVVLFCTGNDYSSTIWYPASNSNVIAVGATDNKDKRASFSNYSTGLDVVAPGVDIYVTDRQGGVGYNRGSGVDGDYYSAFTGTSAACPQVAGVMALILSVNPNLTQLQARQILESNTDKISGYTYSSNVSGQPNGTWNNEVGYGRVNAYKAVLAAAGGQISGPSLICTSGGDVRLSNVPSGSAVVWSTSDRLTITSGQGTSTVTVAAASATTAGSATVSVSLGGCNTVASLSTWAGVPNTFTFLSGNTSPLAGSSQTYSSSTPSSSSQVTRYNWYFDANIPLCVGNNVVSGPDGICYWPDNRTTFTRSTTLVVGGFSATIRLGYVNSCGESSRKSMSITPTLPSGTSCVCTYGNGVSRQASTEDADAELSPEPDSDMELKIYPNPISNTLYVDLAKVKDEGLVYLTFYNLLGQVVYQTTSAENLISIPVEGLKPDVYYLTIARNDKLFRERVVVIK